MDEAIQVLVVDDDETFRRTISRELAHMGFEVKSVGTGDEAIASLRSEPVDVTLLDIRMPGMDGMATLEAVWKEGIETQVVMLTGHGTVENAVQAMKMGAYDYLIKPCPLDELEMTVRRAWEKGRLVYQNAVLRQRLARGKGEEDIVGESPAIQSLLYMIERVAPSDSTVLVCGESGVGKELVAQAVHGASRRSDAPFVVIDCAALQENLLESELFGHERGAYTGAAGLKHGLLEVADSGTILLDEVGELSPGIQAKLLRALETGTFRRIGGTKNIHVDVRVLAATNRDLEQFVDEGRFRRDLFFRLNVVSITVPPLRSRREDIPHLARHFLAHGRSAGRWVEEITQEAMDLLLCYSWPGNVRELQNCIERAALLCKGTRILPEDLPDSLRSTPQPWPEAGSYQFSLQEAEGHYIAQVLRQVDGHRAQAAEILGISERHLYRKIREHNISTQVTDSSE